MELSSIRYEYFSAEAGYWAIKRGYWKNIVPCNGSQLSKYDDAFQLFQLFQFQLFQLKYEEQKPLLKAI